MDGKKLMPGVGGGGGWAQLELTGTLITSKRRDVCSSDGQIHQNNAKDLICRFNQG